MNGLLIFKIPLFNFFQQESSCLAILLSIVSDNLRKLLSILNPNRKPWSSLPCLALRPCVFNVHFTHFFFVELGQISNTTVDVVT